MARLILSQKTAEEILELLKKSVFSSDSAANIKYFSEILRILFADIHTEGTEPDPEVEELNKLLERRLNGEI